MYLSILSIVYIESIMIYLADYSVYYFYYIVLQEIPT